MEPMVLNSTLITVGLLFLGSGMTLCFGQLSSILPHIDA